MYGVKAEKKNVITPSALPRTKNKVPAPSVGSESPSLLSLSETALLGDDEVRLSARDACSHSCGARTRIRKQVAGLCASSGISAFGSAPKCVN